MSDIDFNIRIKKETPTPLSEFKNQSLLKRKFGEDAVKLYNMIDSEKTASDLISALGMKEERFIEILEFMNNNAMISMIPEEGQKSEPISPPTISDLPKPSLPDKGEGKLPEQKKAPYLSHIENMIYEEYGDLGIKIYHLIDGEKTAEEILAETKISEAKLVEILEFFDENGIIKLEKPYDKKHEDAQKQETSGKEPKFKPIVEEAPEAKPLTPPPIPKKAEKSQPPPQKHEVEVPGEDIIMVDVPSMSKLSVMQKALMVLELSRFPPQTRKLFDMVDGKRDFVELALLTGLSFFEVDSAMAYFGKKGFVTFRQLSREEIKEKYGEDGFAIYKKFGRDGLLIYEMIGKVTSIKEIIMKSKIEPDRAIDIFSFIHKVLGLDVPLDRDIIYKQIGLKK